MKTLRTYVMAMNVCAACASPLDGFDRQRAGIRARVSQLHSEMIAATTEKEWKSLSYSGRKLLTDSGT